MLIHELDHAIRKYFDSEGKPATRIYLDAIEGVDQATRDRITEAYKKTAKPGEAAATVMDETNAYYAEQVLGNKYTLEKLLEAEPTLKDKILSFFKGASTDYADVPKLSGAAKKYYRTYKKLFDEFSARNYESNAIEPNTIKNDSYINENGVSGNVRTTDDNIGKQYSIVEPFTDDNGKAFKNAVLLDTNFFDGLSPRNWGTKLKEYVENRSENEPFILQIADENSNKQDLTFAKKSDQVQKNGGSKHKALSKIYQSSDNISKLSTIHIDEIIEVSEENNPYYTSENSHGWFDKNGWLHRNANVINAKTGAIYNVTVDIAKTADGRTVLYATQGKIKRVGQAKVSSLVIRGSSPHSNSKGSISHSTEKSNTSAKKSSEKSSGKQYALDIDSEGENISGAEVMGWLNKKPRSDGKLDLEATVARGLPYKRGKSDLTVGELRKVIANTTHEKVYSKSDALKAVNKLSGTWGLTVKARDEIADTVWQFLNEAPDIEYRQDMAHDIAEYIVAKVLMDSKTENPDALEAAERLSYLRTGIGKLSFSDEDIARKLWIEKKGGFLPPFYINKADTFRREP